MPPSGGTPWDINVFYTTLKSTFNGLQFRRWHYRFIFIRLAIVASQNREIRRNADKIWPYTSWRSSKVIDLGVNRMLTCDADSRHVLHQLLPPLSSASQNYTVSQKRRHYTLVHIFAKYWPILTIHQRTQLEICNKIINKDPTSPQMCCYTTLWNVPTRQCIGAQGTRDNQAAATGDARIHLTWSVASE